MLEKLSWCFLTGLMTLMLLMWKWMGLFLRENHLLRCWGWLALLNCLGSYIILLIKVPPRKLKPWFVLWSFFLLRLVCISINLPYSYVWNTVVTSELMSLVATWNCQISYKNGFAGLLVLHLLPLLNSSFPCFFCLFNLLFLEGGVFVILIDCIFFLSPFLDITRMSSQ